jgi:hypothetical protein
MYGGWTITPRDYVTQVARLADRVGGLTWASPQDWMCEDSALHATGLTVEDHQRRTTDNFLQLRALGRPYGLHFIPVIQGRVVDDYIAHVEQYECDGVDLRVETVVGVGSVCRRQGTKEAEDIFRALRARGLRLHGFGVKRSGFKRFGHLLHSSDSMAWSVRARRHGVPMYADCPHAHCGNCYRWALAWRVETLKAAYRPEEYDLTKPLAAPRTP